MSVPCSTCSLTVGVLAGKASGRLCVRKQEPVRYAPEDVLWSYQRPWASSTHRSGVPQPNDAPDCGAWMSPAASDRICSAPALTLAGSSIEHLTPKWLRGVSRFGVRVSDRYLATAAGWSGARGGHFKAVSESSSAGDMFQKKNRWCVDSHVISGVLVEDKWTIQIREGIGYVQPHVWCQINILKKH